MARSAVTTAGLKKSQMVGIIEMRDTLGKIIDRTSAQNLKSVFMDAGRVLYDELHARAPRPSKGSEDFPAGAVQDAIFMSEGTGKKPNILVGIGKKNGGNVVALWYEYGTVKQRPRPFFRQAIAASKVRMAQIIADGIQAAIALATK